MLKAKYKLHRLINILFYFIVFALGFILGGGHYEKVIDMFNSII